MNNRDTELADLYDSPNFDPDEPFVPRADLNPTEVKKWAQDAARIPATMGLRNYTARDWLEDGVLEGQITGNDLDAILAEMDESHAA